MDKISIYLILLLTLIAVNVLAVDKLGESRLQIDSKSISKIEVTGLLVEDYPNDNGTGLIISWEPLPKEAKVIEYRIYRGVSPDTLFYISSVEVEPKMGVVAPRLIFYDRGFTGFVSHYSPGRLKKEPQKDDNSVIYDKMPRDLDVFTKYLSHYTVLGEIDSKGFYYRSQPVVKNNDLENDEEELYGGLSFRRFEGLYSMLIPNKPYYYAVVAIDQQRRYFKHSQVVEGIATPNPPDKPARFEGVFLTDADKMQFEWSNPVFDDDIVEHKIYVINKADSSKMNRFIEGNPDGHYDAAKNPATLIYSTNLTGPNALSGFAAIELVDGAIPIIGTDKSFSFDKETSDNYCFILSLNDYNGFETFSDFLTLSSKTKDLLPILPSYVVVDKPDDMGDCNQILIERPLIFFTQGAFINQNSRVLELNYELTENELDRVKKVLFRFTDSEGELIAEVDEFFIDNVVRIKLKDRNSVYSEISVEIIPYTTLDSYGDGVHLHQTFQYDTEFGFINFGELIYNDEEIADYRLVLYKRAKSSPSFHQAMTISPFAKAVEDNIPYEKSIFQMISKYDRDRKLLLFDSNISVGYDEESGMPLATTIYPKEAQKQIEKLKQKIEDLENDENSSEEEIGYFKKLYSLQTEHPVMGEANRIDNRKERIKYLRRVKDENTRSIEYRLVKTDGKGLFTIGDTYTDEEGNTFIKPFPNWFNRTQLPTLIATTLFAIIVFLMMKKARSDPDMYVRPIAGLEEIDNAIGRATEMGRPILYVPGIGAIDEIATLASISILSKVATKAAEYDTKLLVPLMDYIVLPIAMETVKESYTSAGRPDAYVQDNVFYIAGEQFAYVAGVNGVMAREKVATNFFLGVFFAEALLMTEAGNALGAVQIAGSDSITQIPFFITTCDYTLIGEELYGASAYLSREPNLMGNLKAMDYAKLIILCMMVLGTFFSTIKMTFFINAFPSQ